LHDRHACYTRGGDDEGVKSRKRIALIAHDNCKADLVEWVRYNRGTLTAHDLCATGTSGSILSAELALDVERFLSGPLGGDQQVGAAIVEGRIDLVVFFWDPLEPHPHDVDVKALLRIAVVYNIPIACNRSSADFMLSSPLLGLPYQPMRRRRQASGRRARIIPLSSRLHAASEEPIA
jgi:methylglyoxal synthase